jgi:EAL domain-containing protein (putative c-di-GMP-specific phosphodiesterase class I)
MTVSRYLIPHARQDGSEAAPDTAQELRAQAARANAAERRRLSSRLRQALAHDEFALLYQLQISLKTGLPRGAEALICLRHRRRGLVPPNRFMPSAEQSSVASEIGNWGIRQTCRDAAQLNRHFIFTITVSHRQLLHGHLVKQVVEALAKFELDARQVEFALPETALIDENDDVSFALRALRGLGAGLVLNNFGTGYTSLALLKRLPLTMLKLDRSMTEGLPTSHENEAILCATIQAAHALSIGVIADGVESEAHSRVLAGYGCDFAQGAHWHPPMAFDDLKRQLARDALG